MSSLSFEEFKFVEFSKSLDVLVPVVLSCNQCEDAEDDSKNQDSVLSFLVKFKADKLGNPKKIRSEGLIGFVLPEGKGYDYRKEPGEPSGFKSVTENHFNLYTKGTQIESIALSVYSDPNRRLRFPVEEIGDFLLSSHKKSDWATLLDQENRKNWKKFVQVLLLKKFETKYGKIERTELKRAYGLDPEDLRAHLEMLNEYGCLNPKDVDEIRTVLGKDALK